MDKGYLAISFTLKSLFMGLKAMLQTIATQPRVSAEDCANMSRLVMGYLRLWSEMLDTYEEWGPTEVARAKKLLSRLDGRGLDCKELNRVGVDPRPLRTACAEALTRDAETGIFDSSAQSLMYLEGVLSALPWTDEASERISKKIKWLWVHVPMLVAERTGIHAAYKFGMNVAEEQAASLGVPLRKIHFTEAMYASFIPDERALLFEELAADTQEYFRRAPTEEEEMSCEQTYSDNKWKAETFINAELHGDQDWIDEIKPW